MKAESDMNEIEKYIDKYVTPCAYENMIKGFLLPYMPYKYLKKIYGEETATKPKKLVPDFTNWHPTSDYNHAWNIVRLLEGFGYTRYGYDTVFYTFTLDCPNPNSGHDDWHFEGDGLNFGQAVCNTLIKFANEYKFPEREENKNAIS